MQVHGEESAWVQYVREHYEPDPEVKPEYEDKAKFLLLLNAPEEYGVEEEMLAYAKAQPTASMQELIEYFDEITEEISPIIVVTDNAEHDCAGMDDYEERMLVGLERFMPDEKSRKRVWREIVFPSLQFCFGERMVALIEAYPDMPYEEIKLYCDYLHLKKNISLAAACGQEATPLQKKSLEEYRFRMPAILQSQPHGSHHNYDFFVPMSEEDFRLFVINILGVLKYELDSYLCISLKDSREDRINTIQSCLAEDNNTYEVEVIITEDGADNENWQVFTPAEACSFDEAVRLFRRILVDNGPLDISTWVDRTEEAKENVIEHEQPD